MDRELRILNGEGLRESGKGAMRLEGPKASRSLVFHRDIKKHFPARNEVVSLYFYITKLTCDWITREGQAVFHPDSAVRDEELVDFNGQSDC